MLYTVTQLGSSSCARKLRLKCAPAADVFPKPKPATQAGVQSATAAVTVDQQSNFLLQHSPPPKAAMTPICCYVPPTAGKRVVDCYSEHRNDGQITRCRWTTRINSCEPVGVCYSVEGLGQRLCHWLCHFILTVRLSNCFKLSLGSTFSHSLSSARAYA